MFRARLTPLNDFISSVTHTFCYAVLKQLLLAINSLKIGLKVVKIICEVQFGAEILLLPERRTSLHVYNDRYPGLQLLSGYLIVWDHCHHEISGATIRSNVYT